MMRSQELSELGNMFCRIYRMALGSSLLIIPADVKETATADLSSDIERLQPTYIQPK
jgi:hypothetical protein